MAKEEIIDLASFDTIKSADEGAWLNLKNPTNLSIELKSGGKPITLHLLGRDSEAFRKASRAMSNRRLKATAAARGGRAPVSAEEMEIEGKRLVIACTIGWNNVTIDGVVTEFTPENVEMFYERFPAFFEQADDFIGARENFLKV